MKTLAIVAITGALASPVLAFAQQNPDEPVTRAQVRNDLAQLEQAGYNPALSDNAHYPDDIQAAEARVSAQNDAQLTNNAMGGVPAGSSASGGPSGGTYETMSTTSYQSYPSYPAGGAYGAARCNGPQTFCNIYSGGR